MQHVTQYMPTLLHQLSRAYRAFWCSLQKASTINREVCSVPLISGNIGAPAGWQHEPDQIKQFQHCPEPAPTPRAQPDGSAVLGRDQQSDAPLDRLRLHGNTRTVPVWHVAPGLEHSPPSLLAPLLAAPCGLPYTHSPSYHAPIWSAASSQAAPSAPPLLVPPHTSGHDAHTRPCTPDQHALQHTPNTSRQEAELVFASCKHQACTGLHSSTSASAGQQHLLGDGVLMQPLPLGITSESLAARQQKGQLAEGVHAPAATQPKPVSSSQSQPQQLQQPQQQLTLQAASTPSASPSSLPSAGPPSTSATSMLPPAAAGQCFRQFNSDATNPAGLARFSDRIKGCDSLNQLLMLWQTHELQMRTWHLALVCAQAIKLRQEGRYMDMSDYDAKNKTRVILTSVANRVQLEACTVTDLELLLTSWASFTQIRERKASRPPWMPPQRALLGVVMRLKPDPSQALTDTAAAGAATRLNPMLTRPHPHSAAVQLVPALAHSQPPPSPPPSPPPRSSPLSPLRSSPALFQAPADGNAGSARDPPRSIAGPSPSTPPAGGSSHDRIMSRRVVAVNASSGVDPHERALPQPRAASSALMRDKGVRAADRPRVPYGDKLKTASCSSLAAIALALARLGQLDTGMVQLVAEIACKKAKHGSVADLSALAHLLRKEGWSNPKVFHAFAEAATPKVPLAHEPEYITRLLSTLVQVGVRHQGLMEAVADDVVARRDAYVPWGPRIAYAFASSGFDHHLAFEALVAMGLSRQRELSLGLWTQLISACAALGRHSPELCAAACRNATVPIQYVLLKLGQGGVIAHTLDIEAPGATASHMPQPQQHCPASYHARVFWEVMPSLVPPVPRYGHLQQGLSQSSHRDKRQAYWRNYQDRSALEALRQQQQQQQEQRLRGQDSQTDSGDLLSQQPLPPQQPPLRQQAPVRGPAHEDDVLAVLDASVTQGLLQEMRAGVEPPALQSLGPPHRYDQEWERAVARLRKDVDARRRQKGQQQQRQQQQGAGPDAGIHPHLLRVLKAVDVRQPSHRLELVRGMCGLLHGLGALGHYDRELVGLACQAVRAMCEGQSQDKARPLHEHEVAHSITQAVRACAALRHHDAWVVSKAVDMLVHTASDSRIGIGSASSVTSTSASTTTQAAQPELLGPPPPILAQRAHHPLEQEGLALGHRRARPPLQHHLGALDWQHQQAMLLLQLLQAVAALQGPPFRSLLQRQHKQQQQQQQQQQQGAGVLGRPPALSQGWVRAAPPASHAHPAPAPASAELRAAKGGGDSWLGSGSKPQAPAVEGDQGAASVAAAAAAAPEDAVLDQAVQLLARAHTAFMPSELCDMLGALALLELCPWEQLVQPSLCRLAEVAHLKPPGHKASYALGHGSAAFRALGLVQALVHGGYSPDKLDNPQKVQVYQMFLVAQAHGWQAEFRDALGSWDAIRDARDAWHAAQPRMPRDVVQALKTALARIQLPGPVLENVRTKDGCMEVQLGVGLPGPGRLLCFEVLGPEQCAASEPHARTLGHARWRSRCLAQRGVDCIALTWHEYQAAMRCSDADECVQRKDSGLTLLLEQKIQEQSMQTHFSPPFFNRG